MKNRALATFLGLLLAPALAFAQQRTITGKVTNEAGSPLSSVQVVIKGTTIATSTNDEGGYVIQASSGQILQFRFIGTAPIERTVGTSDQIDVVLRRVATNLDAVVVTALGQTTAQRAIGTAQQMVEGSQIAQTQRMNFVHSLQGRVAGVEVITTSGMPGASSSITIRGISSISSSNQPLMIIDGIPLDNKTLHTCVFASSRGGSTNSFENRSVDFTNRAADVNPEDIENLVVLKGPEAAALYGIDAANGAIVITTKRGKAGSGSVNYSNSFRVENTNTQPELQTKYGLGFNGQPAIATNITYPAYYNYGPEYAPGTTLYNNVDGFFQSAFTQKHNLSFDGGTDK